MPLGPKLAEAQKLRVADPDSGDARFIMLGAFGALVIAVLTTFGPHRASAFAVEQRLGDAVQAALAKSHYGAGLVRMSGQAAILEGVVSTPKQAVEAGKIALTAAGKGGAWRGGIVRVVNHVTAAHAAAAESSEYRVMAKAEANEKSERMKFWRPAQVGAELANAASIPIQGVLAQGMTTDMVNFGTVRARALRVSRRGGAPWFT